MPTGLIMIHVNEDLMLQAFEKKSWQAVCRDWKVLQAAFFRYSCLLRPEDFMRLAGLS
jgi:hypothetical protein